MTSDGPAFPGAGNPHVNNGQGELGSGGSGPYLVTLDGAVLDTASVTNVTAGLDLSLEVSSQSADTTFKGVLITVQADGNDVSGSLKLSDETNANSVKIMESSGEGGLSTCPGDVSGATHTEGKVEKTSVPVTLNVASAVGTVDLTVTVMQAGTAWYFSTFGLNVVAGAPTPAATGTPTSAPVEGGSPTTSPTSSPVAGDGPTTAPTSMPTALPSAAPVLNSCAVSALVAASAFALSWIFS